MTRVQFVYVSACILWYRFRIVMLKCNTTQNSCFVAVSYCTSPLSGFVLYWLFVLAVCTGCMPLCVAPNVLTLQMPRLCFYLLFIRLLLSIDRHGPCCALLVPCNLALFLSCSVRTTVVLARVDGDSC